MLFPKFALEGVQTIRRAQSLDRHDVHAISPDRQGQAGADAVADRQDGACAAYAVLAADMRSSQSEGIAQKIGKQQARFDARLICSSVDGDTDIHLQGFAPTARVHAVVKARSASAPIRFLRYSAETWMSLSGETQARTIFPKFAAVLGSPSPRSA